MNLKLFELALDRLAASDWATFEKLCSAFLAHEFPQIRTLANPSGDGGRDSEIFQPEGKPLIACQYSVQEQWKRKIQHTATRLEEKFPDVKILIFLSNRQIGAAADDTKASLMEKGVHLDIRDKNWFLERARLTPEREESAEDLINVIARPYLVGENLIDKPSSPLSSGEARAAHLFLTLQWQDDITDKGLTKLSYDALVRAALRHTHSECRMSRRQIHERVKTLLTNAEDELISRYIDAALSRLAKRYVRHWVKQDEFCLTHQEHERIIVRLAENLTEETLFDQEVRRLANDFLHLQTTNSQPNLEDLVARVRRTIEEFLLRRGEVFATAVMSNELGRIGFEQLTDIIFADILKHPCSGSEAAALPIFISSIVRELLTQPTDVTQRYLRRLSDSYTLFSFLRQTPDVQSAAQKLFSHGKIWLDTTVLLPVFAETSFEDEVQRRFTRLFATCIDVGMELCVTSGIIREICTHMNTCQACSQYVPGTWRGRTPYLYNQYLQTGGPPSAFIKWLSLFRGSERPEDDIAQYLHESLNIKKVNLTEFAGSIDSGFRWAAERLWSDAHQQRRLAQSVDDATTQKLIEHDVETYLGVIALRQAEQVTELGYKHWLLTLDSIAWQIRDRLWQEFGKSIPQSPLMSVDFLVNNLAFGPGRRQMTRAAEMALPVMLDVEITESMPQDIVALADKVRQENEGLPETVIRRKVRDEVDKLRRRRGFGTAGATSKIQLSRQS